MSTPQDSVNDEWMHVSRGRGKRASARPPILNSFPAISKDLKIATIRKDHDRKLKAWRSSTCRQTLQRVFKTLRPDAGWQVQNAICLAMGSLSRDNLECRRRSMWQMAVFVDIISLLEEDTQNTIEAALQDPAFTDLDRDFFRELGMSDLPLVLNTTRKPGLGPAQTQCGENSFILELFMDMETQGIRELVEADVEVYIGSSLQSRIDRAGTTHEQNKLALAFERRYQMHRFPTFVEDPNIFEGLCIFTKKRDEDT
ncbi:uncharacterized protein K489DRAFT_321144 [Dissoconium aciculare CBS 342.82]|uniref:SRR1-like domain-containing protein n=1 Tax=Dissoconium aciculare CBS 342.82 TaxID=1314786 RepID=A0A6J3M1X0_9PEZI|nr:uncharacterized protein K489DRAFT_321144 [Dissoconium aciculare CBS 342.82]KAF1822015.1 hypothetical protein K489DRAFT_321144 [Dissoconium aciculare CBS 342.82]